MYLVGRHTGREGAASMYVWSSLAKMGKLLLCTSMVHYTWNRTQGDEDCLFVFSSLQDSIYVRLRDKNPAGRFTSALFLSFFSFFFDEFGRV